MAAMAASDIATGATALGCLTGDISIERLLPVVAGQYSRTTNNFTSQRLHRIGRRGTCTPAGQVAAETLRERMLRKRGVMAKKTRAVKKTSRKAAGKPSKAARRPEPQDALLAAV